MIYLDNAATTIHKPSGVIEAVVNAMSSVGNASRGAHKGSLDAGRTVYEAREKLADFFGCTAPDHVVFTMNSTEALNMAISGTLERGDHVITTDLEHNSVLRPLYRLEEERGIELDFVGADQQGRIDYADFEALIRENTKAIVCTHASNLTGCLVDIGRVGELAKKRGLLFIVDASQTAGAFPIDMRSMGVDILCFTGHKSLMGPQGTGGLCIGKGIEIAPWKSGGTGVQTYSRRQPEEYPARLEAGTLNAHGIAGLSAAIDFIQTTGIEEIRRKESGLAMRFYQGIKNIEGVRLYGADGMERTPIVLLNIRDYDSSEVADELVSRFDIATRAGGHCAPRLHEALGTKKQGAVRFSFSYFNTEDEAEAAVRAVRELASL